MPALLLLLIAAWTAFAEPARGGAPGPAARGKAATNVLILVTDDQGVDQVGAYQAHPKAPRTPNIDALARDGVLFRNAWASPTCSPSRGAILTGRLPGRTGLGSVIHPDEVWEMPTSEIAIPRMLRGAPTRWSTAAVGKWHIAGPSSDNALKHPQMMGFDHFSGTIGNIGEAIRNRGDDLSYRHWEKVVDGKVSMSEEYATTATVDDALAQIRTLPEPWLVYVAFNAPHYPWHEPPKALWDGDLGPGAGDAQKYRAMVEALDHEIGRLLDGLGPKRDRTTILFLSDNGTPDETTLEPWPADRAKNTPFEGGIHVPFIVAGPQVAQPGTESEALVHVADVFATVADIANVPLGADARGPLAGVRIDGQSVLPLLANPRARGREVVFTEKFAPNGKGESRRVEWRISRNAELKLIETNEHGYRVFDMRDGRDDGPGMEPRDVPPELAASWQQLKAAHEQRFGADAPGRGRGSDGPGDGDGPRGEGRGRR